MLSKRLHRYRLGPTMKNSHRDKELVAFHVGTRSDLNLFSFGETALGGRSHPATQPAHPDQATYQQVRAIANQLE